MFRDVTANECQVHLEMDPEHILAGSFASKPVHGSGIVQLSPRLRTSTTTCTWLSFACIRRFFLANSSQIRY